MKPFLLIQLSDLHIGASWTDRDPLDTLAAAVAAVEGFPNRPDAVVVTGDLMNDASEDQCAAASELLAQIGTPVYVLPGNHDDRDLLRRFFDLPGARWAPVQYAADLGPLRLLLLDSTRPGSGAAELDAGRLEWLAAELDAEPDKATLIAMHHPPLVIGIAPWDALGFPPPQLQALEEIVARHPQVRGVIAGHLHRPIAGELAGRPVLACPSTYAQAVLDFESSDFVWSSDPPAFALHTLVEGKLVSHVQSF